MPKHSEKRMRRRFTVQCHKKWLSLAVNAKEENCKSFQGRQRISFDLSQANCVIPLMEISA